MTLVFMVQWSAQNKTVDISVTSVTSSHSYIVGTELVIINSFNYNVVMYLIWVFA